MKEGPSYSEMIITSLKALGGRGTSAQIADYISQHYSEVLKYKTKTWRNSVMGCLSVKNHLFNKEPMEGRPDKYIWVLRDLHSDHQHHHHHHSSSTTTQASSPTTSRSKRLQKKRTRTTYNTTSNSTNSSNTINGNVNGNHNSDEDEQALAGLLLLEDLTTNNNNNNTPPTTMLPTTPETASPLNGNNAEEKIKVDVDLITSILTELNGSGTTEQITETILQHHKESFPNYSRRKLAYTINAILSAPKYRDRFGKEKQEGQTTSTWKLLLSMSPSDTKMDDKLDSDSDDNNSNVDNGVTIKDEDTKKEKDNEDDLEKS